MVAKDFEESNQEGISKDSPTCSKKDLRTTLAINAQYQWKLYAIGIKIAFLQGDKIYQEVYAIPLKDAKHRKGFGDESRKCYDGIKPSLLSIGLVTQKGDPATFYYHNSNHKPIEIIVLYVDDFHWSDTNDFGENFISLLQNTFIIGKENQ